MLKHYYLLIVRHFRRHKTTFFINLAGLSTGLACAVLIYLWVSDEISFDKFHERDQQLYQVFQNAPLPDGIFTTEGTPGLLYEALVEEMREVEETAIAAYSPGGRVMKGVVVSGDTHLKVSEQYVSKNYFNLFSYRLISGDKKQVLVDKYSVVLSDELALKLFHTTENVVGRTVEWRRKDLNGVYTVSGVFEKTPVNSSTQFDLLFTYELLFEKYSQNLSNWGNSRPMTYLILKKGTDVSQFNEKIRDFSKLKYKETNHKEGDWIGTLFVQRYSDKYLYNKFENGKQAGGRIDYVKLFSIIAVFILVIACINFMNLSTAKATTRLKEIGVRKAIGADRKALIFQHIGESLMITFLSLFVAGLIVGLLLPEFNTITGKHLVFHFSAGVVITLLSIALITGLFSGSYPALYLSGVKPAMVLKGSISTSVGEQWVRKGLVVFQFAVSIILIVSVIVVYKQIRFINNKDLGYSKDNVIRFTNEGNLPEKLEVFLTEVKRIPGVVNASSFGNDITANEASTSGIDWDGQTTDERINFGNMECDYDLAEVFGFKMMEGRSFSREFAMENTKIIFNEAAIAAMGIKDPVGKYVRLWGERKQIIGVVKDFHFESLYEPVKPCFLQLSQGTRANIVVKIKAGMESTTLSGIEKLYTRYNDGVPFEYRFINEDYQIRYAAEQRVSMLSRYFAGMAVIISCLGLFGLAAFTAQRRVKEISIRKVLGSTEFGIVSLLSGEFNKLVFASILIALPLSYLIAEHWLDSFAFRIDLKGWFFASAGMLAFLISSLTVGMQTLRAARIDPVNNLRTE